jgi:uncharacterized protein YjiK
MVRQHSVAAILFAAISGVLLVMAILFWFRPNNGTLADFVRTRSFKIAEIPRNLSGITYSAESGTLFLVSNTPTRIYEITREGRFIRQIDLAGFYDTEDIVFIEKHTFAVVEEKRRTIIIFQVFPETKTVHYANCRRIQVLPPEGVNTGLEGLAWDPDSRTFLVSQEANPRAVYRILYNGVGDTDRFRNEVTALHNLPWFKLGDYAGIYFDSTSQRLMILSQKTGNIMDFSLEGHEKGRLNLSRFISGIVKTEGLTVGPEGDLYVCSEPNIVFVFSRDQR